MFNSIRAWMNIPITIKPITGRNAAGDKQFGTSVQTNCYPVGDVKVVRNDLGVDVTSNTQLYIDGSVPVSTVDNIVFEGKEKPIHAISTYYRNGVPDIKVVYL